VLDLYIRPSLDFIEPRGSHHFVSEGHTLDARVCHLLKLMAEFNALNTVIEFFGERSFFFP
jgi:hypothetical protein